MDGKDLKKMRTRLGYTSTRFAKKIGVSRLSLMNWEKGITPISQKREKQIKQTLGFESDKDRANLNIHIDYLKLTFFETTVETIIEHVLGFETRFFETEKTKANNYNFIHRCGSIILFSKEDQGQGVLLELKAEGVKQFEEHLLECGLDLENWLKQIFNPSFYLKHELYSRLHSTRIDIAIDEMYDEVRGNFDLSKLQEKVEHDLCYSTLRSYYEIRTRKQSESYGVTLNWGARSDGGMRIRMYEKRFELAKQLKVSVEDALAQSGIWNRYEIEIGKKVNPQFFERYLNGESLEDIAVDLLLTKIEFYEEIETEDGIERQGYEEWYEIFGYWKKIKISSVSIESFIEKSMKWIETQIAPTLKMLVEIFGEEWVFQWLRYIIKEAELPSKKQKQVDFEKMKIRNKENLTFLYFDKKINGEWQGTAMEELIYENSR